MRGEVAATIIEVPLHVFDQIIISMKTRRASLIQIQYFNALIKWHIAT